MCSSLLPCQTGQLIILFSMLIALCVVFYAIKKPSYFLYTLPIIILSIDAFARAGGGSNTKCGLACIILAPFFLAYAAYISYKINQKNKKVKQALAIMESREPQWSEDKLVLIASNIFRQLQTAWGQHDLETIKNHLHPSLYTDWEIQIKEQKLRNERNVMLGLSIENVRIVNVKNFTQNEHDEFTVCFDAEANDQTLINDSVKTEKHEKFREFWTFEWESGKWTLREVSQSGGWKRFVYAPIVDEMNRKSVDYKKVH